MASKYKVIFRKGTVQQGEHRVLWAPGCPLYVDAVQIARDTQTGDAFLQIKLVNASRFNVMSFDASATVTFEDGTQETVKIENLDADIPPGKSFTPLAHQLEQGRAKDAQVTIANVVSGGNTWEASEAQPVDFPKNERLTLDHDIRNERFRLLKEAGCAKPNAVDNGLLEDDGWWLCACGALNVGRTTCHACGLSPERLRELEDPDYLEKSATAFAAQQEAAIKQEAENKKKRIKSISIAAVAAVLLIAVLAAVAILTQPSLEDRLEAHVWQTTTESSVSSLEMTVDMELKDGKIDFSWAGQSLTAGKYEVTGPDTIKVSGLGDNKTSGTWHISFSNNDRKMTVEGGGSEMVFTAKD